MPCIKTGCHIWIQPYREYAYGDAFEIEPILPEHSDIWRNLKQQGLIEKIKEIAYFRLVGRGFEPLNGVNEVHYVVHDYDNWLDKDSRLSTVITNNFTKGPLAG